MKIAPSILSADFANLQTDVEKVEQAQVDMLHIDVMDGHFVPNLTFGPNVVAALRPHSQLVFDCHLMIENPENYVEAFADAGADLIGVQYESTPNIHRALDMIKKKGKLAEIVINPGTPVSAISSLLAMVDQVLVMTVDPGFGGQKFMPEMLDKVAELAQIKQEKGYHYEIQVDGGVNDQTIKQCAQAGATVAVAGSFVFKGDPAVQVEKLRQAAVEEAL